jgi:hypothetical protein
MASWWVALTLVPLALTGWGAFIYAGVRGRKRGWVAFGLAYFVLTVVGWVLAQADSLNGLAGAIILITWAATFVHALAIRSDANERIAMGVSPTLMLAEEREREREEALRVVARDPHRARELGIGRPDRHGFDGGLVDLNSAPALEIGRLPGVSSSLAHRIVTIREEVGGFSSLEDCGLVLSLDAPTLDRMRPHAVVLPRD